MDKILKAFKEEKCVFVAEPILKATKSWLSLEDAGDNQKARMLYYDALAGNKLYMVNVNDKFAKLYIKNSKNIWCVYVQRDTLDNGERYHGNQEN